jgi:hypothetical protein
MLAWRFKWPPSEFDQLTGKKLLFWVERLIELDKELNSGKS